MLKNYFFRQIDKLVNKGIKVYSPHQKDDTKIEELHLELTFRCNSKCIMCDIWHKDRAQPELRKKELSLEEIKRFVTQSKLLKGLKKIMLTGGEPFSREDLVEISGFFIQQYPDISLGILTNLVDTEKILTQTQKIVEQYNPKNLWFSSSLDGIGTTHDIMRGRKGAFDSLIKTIKRLHTDFPELSCNLSFIITPRNYKDLLRAYNLAEELDCLFGAQFVVQKEETEKFNWNEYQLAEIQSQVDVIIDRLCSKYLEVSEILEKIDPLWHIGTWTEILFWRYLIDYARKPKRYLKYCFTGKKYVIVDPRGNTYLCPVYRETKIGNLRKQSFDKLWFSQQAKKIRKYVEEDKCHCWHFCSIIPVAKEIFQYAFKRNRETK